MSRVALLVLLAACCAYAREDLYYCCYRYINNKWDTTCSQLGCDTQNHGVGAFYGFHLMQSCDDCHDPPPLSQMDELEVYQPPAQALTTENYTFCCHDYYSFSHTWDSTAETGGCDIDYKCMKRDGNCLFAGYSIMNEGDECSNPRLPAESLKISANDVENETMCCTYMDAQEKIYRIPTPASECPVRTNSKECYMGNCFLTGFHTAASVSECYKPDCEKILPGDCRGCAMEGDCGLCFTDMKCTYRNSTVCAEEHIAIYPYECAAGPCVKFGDCNTCTSAGYCGYCEGARDQCVFLNEEKTGGRFVNCTTSSEFPIAPASCPIIPPNDSSSAPSRFSAWEIAVPIVIIVVVVSAMWFVIRRHQQRKAAESRPLIIH